MKVGRRIKRTRIGQGPDSEMVSERSGEVKRADEIFRAAIARLKTASRWHCGRLDTEAENEVVETNRGDRGRRPGNERALGNGVELRATETLCTNREALVLI